MDMSKTLVTQVANLQGGLSQMWRQLNVALDTKLTKSISEHPSLEDFALSVLGINKTDLDRIEEEKRDRKEYIRKIIASSDPSFGRFMTQVYTYYQRLRAIGRRDGIKTKLRAGTRDELLKLLRQKVNATPFTEEALLEMGVLLYKISRTNADSQP